MQCFDDVGGVDCWMGGFWEEPKGRQPTQWWTGWHCPGASGLKGLKGWTWPNEGWTLIGYEKWGYSQRPNRRDVLLEALYMDPNPSTFAQPGPPEGHWHMRF